MQTGSDTAAAPPTERAPPNSVLVDLGGAKPHGCQDLRGSSTTPCYYRNAVSSLTLSNGASVSSAQFRKLLEEVL
jgi:hypothetical protein